MMFEPFGKTNWATKAGLRLRCFLSAIRISLVVTFAFIQHLPIHAQAADIDCFAIKTVKVSHLKGQVFDPEGIQVSGASLSLLVRGEERFTTKSDPNGNFQFEAPPGEYWLRGEAKGFIPATITVRIRHGLTRLLPSKTIYMILGVGVFQPCPPGTSSKREFQQTIKDFQEKIRANATQK